jgi:hypothetical protein
VPRWIAWRSMIPNHTSTRCSHDTDVEVNWTWTREFAAARLHGLSEVRVGEPSSGQDYLESVVGGIAEAAGDMHRWSSRMPLTASVPPLLARPVVK